MSDEASTPYERAMIDYLRQRVSRSQMLKIGGAGLAAAALPGVAHAQTTTTESVQTIINIADTAERLAVTLLTAAVNNASQLGLSGLLLAFVQAALAEEQYHADYLEAAGAKALTNTFTVPDPKILTDQKTFFHTAEAAETLFIGAYMAAVREFTDLGQPGLAKVAYQIGTVEAEHRAHVRAGMVLTGDSSGLPPNNKAFETDVVKTVGDAATALTSLGFIGGSGTAVTYPGREVALRTALPVGASVLEITPSNSAPTGVPLSATLPLRGRGFGARPE